MAWRKKTRERNERPRFSLADLRVNEEGLIMKRNWDTKEREVDSETGQEGTGKQGERERIR